MRAWSLGALALIVFAAPHDATASQTVADDGPEALIERTVQSLLDEFASERERFADQRELFALVDRVAVPLFDFERIAKLVLAKNWRNADDAQRAEFGDAFKKLLIGTYATALFQYTGDERMAFVGSEIIERKGRQFAEVKSEVTLGVGAPAVPVDYSLIRGEDEQWRIYNLSINGLNMVANYRSTYSASIDSLGLDGLIESMQQSNARNNL
ncbi:MAG: MlaC/ttg2D family ABC transporter substrate-binding protein [bacterium]